MNPCVKAEGKCNESVNNEFKIMWKCVFTHGFIQLFFNVMNRIKIINQV